MPSPPDPATAPPSTDPAGLVTAYFRGYGVLSWLLLTGSGVLREDG